MSITINWEAFLLVFGAAVGFTTLIVTCFSLGIRMLSNAQGSSGKARKGNFKAQQVESLNMVGAYVLFAVCVSALLYGIYLVIPFLPH
ncbi:MAG: hypothetical protein RIQ88_1021 [Actinomycetota bacterium]|jgi:hypothetical protein